MWNTLLPELIFEIFSHFLPGLKLVAPRPNLFPWYLGHICKGWRSVFVSSPQFWSTFSLDLKGGLFHAHWKPGLPHLAFIERQLMFLHLCLERSGSFPISFDLATLSHGTSYGTVEPQLLDVNRKILEIVIAESARWQDVNLIVNASDIGMLYQAKGSFSCLRSIRVTLSGIVHCFAAGPRNAFPDLFEDCERLSRVHLERLGDWSFNWSALTVIVIRSIGFTRPREFLHILRQTQCLETLVLGQVVQTTLPDDMDPVALLYLKRLSCDSTAFISFIKAPALEQLWLRNDVYPNLQFLSEDSFNRYVSTFFDSLPSEVQFVMLAPGFTNDSRLLYQYLPKVRRLHLHASDTVENLGMWKEYYRHVRQVQAITIVFGSVQLWDVEEIAVALINWIDEPRPLPFDSLNNITIEIYKNSTEQGLDVPSMGRLKALYDERNIKLDIRLSHTMTHSLSPLWNVIDI